MIAFYGDVSNTTNLLRTSCLCLQTVMGDTVIVSSDMCVPSFSLTDYLERYGECTLYMADGSRS